MDMLCHFARHGDVGRLRTCQGRVNASDDHQRTPLLYAIIGNHLDCVQCLVDERGADVNFSFSLLQRPIVFAAGYGRLDCVKFLVSRGAKRDAFITAFRAAIMSGQVECVKYFVEEHDIDVNKDDKNDLVSQVPVHIAAMYGHLDCVKYFVEKGARVNVQSESFTPLSVAVSKGYVYCAEYLVANGAYIDGPGRVKSPLFRAHETNNDYIMKWLLSMGANPFNDIILPEYDISSNIAVARESYKERLAVQAMMSVKKYPRIGKNSPLRVLPTDIVRRLLVYVVSTRRYPLTPGYSPV
jgi:ankyrin repeat protein